MEASPPSDHPDPIKYAVTHAILIAFCLAPIGMCIKRICCTPSVEGKGDSFWQRSFVAFMLLGCLSRLTGWAASIFVLLPHTHTRISTVANFYWNLYPSFFFSSDYAVVLFSWMEIFHSSSDGKANLKPVYIYTFCVIYLAVIGVMIGDIIIYGTGSTLPLAETILQKALQTFDACIYLIITVGYLAYGGGFYMRFYKNGPLLQKVKQQILPRVKILTIAISICYTFRAVITIWNTWQYWPHDLFWIIDLVYYLFLEILPNVLMLLVLQYKNTDEPMHNTVGSYSSINDP